MTDASDKLDEFQLIKSIAANRGLLPAHCLVDLGDDCFVFRLPGAHSALAVTTDLLVEDVHFSWRFITPWELGRKSAAANLSDLAAMGATPLYAFVGLSLPRHTPLGVAQEFNRGLVEGLEAHGCALCGGDTTGGTAVSVSVTVMGTLDPAAILRRDRFLPGQALLVTGTLGDSAAGLHCLLSRGSRPSEESPPLHHCLVKRHHLPEPRVREGVWLAAQGVTAGMDLSDGLGSDLERVREDSAVGVEVREASLPLSDELLRYCRETGTDPCRFAISGGEDYELLVAVDEALAPDLAQRFNRQFPTVGLTVIGRVTADRQRVLVRPDGHRELLPGPGFAHF